LRRYIVPSIFRFTQGDLFALVHETEDSRATREGG
jgi:hypothetical protein